MIRVEIPAGTRNRFKQALRRGGSREIGGILMARQLSIGHFSIVDFSLDEISGERAHFVRDAEHHREALELFFERTEHDYRTFNYLGEWHSHPSFPPVPSVIDIYSMRELVDGERQIDFAVLLIVKLGFFRRFVASASLHMRGSRPQPVVLTKSR